MFSNEEIKGNITSVEKQLLFNISAKLDTLIDLLSNDKALSNTNTPVLEKVATEEFKCKKCNYKTTNKGELLAHYRTHKKEVK